MTTLKLKNKIICIPLVLILSSSLFFSVSHGEIKKDISIIDFTNPTLVMPNDIYVKSANPMAINFKVYAIDDVDGKISVQCDKTSKFIFKLGKTTVRCEAEDSSGNKSRGSFVVTVGYNIVQIPTWIKQLTKLWVDNSIDNDAYATAMGYLIQKQIVQVPMAKSPNSHESEIPVWIKSNAQSWIDGKRSDDDYSILLLWLINQNIIRI